ncbi:MAG: nitroreductase family deazaflavin-dependent oxidoreductase, partial [Dehalococcoidia bacterium]|nr:nitroreductase family deazaflavin-dependent oxidoreductase [Dehalococcoidia bacterium]
MERLTTRQPPTGPWKLFFRAPIWLYRLHLGWLLGGRFLLMEHVGRRSGLVRRVVVEVVHHDRDADTYTVASGFGPRS